MSREQRTHQRRARRWKCIGCGEPWSTRAVNHQPACEARRGLQSPDSDERATTVATYRRDLDALQREHESEA